MYYNAHFGQGVGVIHYNCLDCSGTKYRLEDCGGNNQSTSNHNYDWSVTCKNGKHFHFFNVTIIGRDTVLKLKEHQCR